MARPKRFELLTLRFVVLSASRSTFGDGGYALEELVAELGAAFLCADLGLHLEDRDDHAAYVGHWLSG
ncbi:zincin-like metallopeptidase domain-containing protein [Mesorhizobium sp. M0292]|uniref:zincin-like metallopeptidase domain-containing protein n=1 Tax=Mesorhizobium sp. M0292 TaxID=2956929 RepID=UPI0033387AA9